MHISINPPSSGKPYTTFLFSTEPILSLARGVVGPLTLRPFEGSKRRGRPSTANPSRTFDYGPDPADKRNVRLWSLVP